MKNIFSFLMFIFSMISSTTSTGLENKTKTNLNNFRTQAIVVKNTYKTQFFYNEQQIKCMALNMYYEARGDNDIGMIAVGYVVMNRTASKDFPKTPCEVINQYSLKKQTKIKICQFSWKCENKNKIIKEKETYQRSLLLASLVLKQEVKNPVGKSLYFHAITKKYNENFKHPKSVKIGSQVYYS